ncbi:MAG: GIY-YIG nuclease family protein [Candidatus Brocadiales bacterium]|nr:GIY-YIG nuclease family protein [Candidatus Brocadiales bacterium]
MNSGVYQIRNLCNDKVYVGSSKDLTKRKREHFRMLRNGTHSNSHLQNSYNKYGRENFEFSIMEKTANLLEVEQSYLDTINNKYNICTIAGSTLGWDAPKGEDNKLSESYRVISPDGAVVRFIGLHNFCRKHSLDKGAMNRVLRGITAHCKGWRKYDTTIVGTAKLPKFSTNYKFRSPDGEIFETNNLGGFSKLHALDNAAMHRTWQQKQTNHKGWTKI